MLCHMNFPQCVTKMAWPRSGSSGSRPGWNCRSCCRRRCCSGRWRPSRSGSHSTRTRVTSSRALTWSPRWPRPSPAAAERRRRPFCPRRPCWRRLCRRRWPSCWRPRCTSELARWRCRRNAPNRRWWPELREISPLEFNQHCCQFSWY